MSKLLTKLSVAALLAASVGAYADDHSITVDGEDQPLADSNQPAVTVPASTRIGEGTLTVNGKLITTTCSFVSDSDKNIVVNLPTEKAQDVKTGAKNGRTAFAINLKDCPTYGHYRTEDGRQYAGVGVYFDDTHQNVAANGKLNNAKLGGNVAQNVQIQILDKDGKAINLKAAKEEQLNQTKHSFVNGDNDLVKLDFFAEYAANGNPVPGEVQTSVPFFVEYR